MNIEKKFTKCKKGIKWEVSVNGKRRASGLVFFNTLFKTLKDKAKYEVFCFISWFKDTTEYKELLQMEANIEDKV